MKLKKLEWETAEGERMGVAVASGQAYISFLVGLLLGAGCRIVGIEDGDGNWIRRVEDE